MKGKNIIGSARGIDGGARVKIKRLEKEVANIQEEIKELKKTRDTNIIDDLAATKSGLGSYLFSYREVAERHGVSLTKVQQVVREHNLERKKRG